MVGGQARNAAEKELVSKLVADIHGVKSVVNTMVVETEKKERPNLIVPVMQLKHPGLMEKAKN